MKFKVASCISACTILAKLYKLHQNCHKLHWIANNEICQKLLKPNPAEAALSLIGNLKKVNVSTKERRTDFWQELKCWLFFFFVWSNPHSPTKGTSINNIPDLYPRKAIISLYFLLSVHFCWAYHCGLDWSYRGDRQRLWCAQTFLLQMPMLNEYTMCSAAGTQMETDRKKDRESQSEMGAMRCIEQCWRK